MILSDKNIEDNGISLYSAYCHGKHQSVDHRHRMETEESQLGYYM